MSVKTNGKVIELEVQNILVESSEKTNTIILPAGMSKLVAAKELKLQHDAEEEVVKNIVEFDTWQWQDVLVAIQKSANKSFGWLRPDPAASAPIYLDVTVDVIDGKIFTEKAYYGSFLVTAWEEGSFNVGIKRDGTVYIQVNAKRKFTDRITSFFNTVRTYLKEHSIFRGKAVVVSGSSMGDGMVDFTIIENIPSDRIILNKAEELVIQDFIIDNLDEPGKHISLMTGNFGTGKTESAMRVGKEATSRNMVFFYLKNPDCFSSLLKLSPQYSPSLLFLEDFDSVATGERDSKINDLLNTLDGVQTKGSKLKVVFTTNNPEKINPAFLRPGRIDLMLEFNFPDKEATEKIYRMYFEGIEGEDQLDYEAVILDATPYVQGAVIAEICKRAVKIAKKRGHIDNNTVISSIRSMDYQIKMMAGKSEEPTLAEKYLEVNKEVIAEAYNES